MIKILQVSDDKKLVKHAPIHQIYELSLDITHIILLTGFKMYFFLFSIYNHLTFLLQELNYKSKKKSKQSPQYMFVCLSALHTVNPALSGHSKRRPKIGFQDR